MNVLWSGAAPSQKATLLSAYAPISYADNSTTNDTFCLDATLSKIPCSEKIILMCDFPKWEAMPSCGEELLEITVQVRLTTMAYDLPLSALWNPAAHNKHNIPNERQIQNFMDASLV